MLHIDCTNGASGDMLASALIDYGADAAKIKGILSKTADIKTKKISKKGVPATKFDVKFSPKSREYADLAGELDKLRISGKVKSLSKNILHTLAAAESKVHKKPLKKVHLHEAADCLVDAVTVALALEDLNLLDSKITATPVSVGRITPATEEIIRASKIPIRLKSDEEITTPTGAAILANIVCEYRESIPMQGRCGVGAGTMDFAYPNVLRVFEVSDLVVLESNIDDSTPELMSYVLERLMEAGARDAHILPCVMKKGRPGFLLRVLTESPEEISEIIMRETNTLGVRVMPVSYRYESEREIKKIKIEIKNKTEYVRVKESAHGSKPEYDDVRRIARKHDLAFREVLDRIVSKG